MRWIYISPHLDDAVLSAGGFIYEQTHAGNSVEIWTIMAGIPSRRDLSPFAQELHKQWGAKTKTAEEFIKLRLVEDANASNIVGAKTRYFNYPDCIYRIGPDGDPLYLDVFLEPDPTEVDLPDEIARSIKAHLQPKDQIICQLGIGRHVDHLIVRWAVERLGLQLWYSTDVPYLFNNPEQLAPQTAGMKKILHPVTAAGLQAWIEAIIAHQSQLSTLFESPINMKEEITSYYKKAGGIHFWRRK
ncbi:MAG: PIG-L family deacetylase [Anaerolineae bacterium]|nr:PIG-L family deacetylase [Anaerolineae bacterium]MDK1081214.1 PIG-L family deacetylase [Anaerolineae bacterium]MDK1118355.1 PIG-L family deacetylase [Anaerolineae bacterium]